MEGHPFEAMATVCPPHVPTHQEVSGQIRGSEKQLFSVSGSLCGTWLFQSSPLHRASPSVAIAVSLYALSINLHVL